MRIRAILLPVAAALCLATVSCVEKDPSWDISWHSGDSGETDTPTPPDPPSPPVPPGPVKDTTLLNGFTQDFPTSDTAPFSLRTRTGTDDFRYYPGFPSLSENGTDILMLRLDPSDAPASCPCLTASANSFYGSYSLRVRTPDLSRVRKTTDAALEFRLETGEDNGSIALRVDLSSPGKVTIGTSPVTLPQNRNLSAGFQTLGWDWTPDCVKWWILDPSSKEKTVLKEIADKGSVPGRPGILSVGVHHTSDAPEYPFETEIDRITYEPFDDK